MKTAVEWFNEQIKLNAEFREIFQGRVSFIIGESKIDELLKQAKEMEKEQIKKAWIDGNYNIDSNGNPSQNYAISDEKYYKQTFKSE
jgi:hypothetical protein